MMSRLTARAWTAAIELACASNTRGDTPLAVKNLRCEYKVDPMGIDVGRLRLRWELLNPERGVLQTGYEIRVAQSEASLATGKLLWDSGEQPSDLSIQVEYGGPALESRRIYYWQVRVRDNHGHLSDWSHIAHWEMGLPEAADWKAEWVARDLAEDETKSNPAALLRREFSFDKKVDRARLYATAMGLYEMSLHGRRVGQTAYALALEPDLLPQEQRPVAAARLAEDVKKFGHLTTGFLGTPVLCQALSDYGYLDLAYMLGHDDLGTMRRHQARRQFSRFRDEFLQSLRLRRDRRVDVSRHRGNRAR